MTLLTPYSLQLPDIDVHGLVFLVQVADDSVTRFEFRNEADFAFITPWGRRTQSIEPSRPNDSDKPYAQ